MMGTSVESVISLNPSGSYMSISTHIMLYFSNTLQIFLTACGLKLKFRSRAIVTLPSDPS